MRPLHGARAHVQPLGRVEAALEVEGLAAPALPHQGDALLGARARIVAVGLEGLVVLQGAAAADADVEAPAAHHVEHGELLGQVDRMVQGQQAHPHAQAQGGRAGREVAGQHGRRRAEAVVVEVMLGEPDGVVAERLGGEHLLEGGVVDGLLAPRLVALHEKEQPELHRVLRGRRVLRVEIRRFTVTEWRRGRHRAPARRGNRPMGYRYFVGHMIVRHMWAAGLESKPRPSLGCLKFRPTTSVNSSSSTFTLGSKA